MAVRGGVQCRQRGRKEEERDRHKEPKDTDGRTKDCAQGGRQDTKITLLN